MVVGIEKELPRSPTGNPWFPAKSVYPVTERAREIAKKREELIGLLRGLPESEFELSLTDLVEKRSDRGESIPEEKKRVAEEESKNLMPKKKNGSRFSSAGSRNGSVMLKVFMPASLVRGLSRSSSSLSFRTPLDSSKPRSNRGVDDDDAQPGCCGSLSWDRSGHGKSRNKG